MKQINVMDDWMESSGLSNQIKFLLIDLDAALTFMDIAETTADEAMRQRNFQNARHAYDTVLRLMQKVTLDSAQNEAIRERLSLLKTRLEAGGQKF